jgi:YHS domain-containing protein
MSNVSFLSLRGCRAAVCLAVLALPLLLLPSGAADPPAEGQKIFCPVVGLPKCECCKCPSGYCGLRPRAAHTLPFEGGSVQFCCGKCKAKFEKSPEKFVANAHHQLVATGQARQAKCPLCGGQPDKAQSLEVAGVTVHVCSAECRDKAVKAAPAEQVELLFGKAGFARGFTVEGKK